jgi:two-component system, cell cycle sensor histidine kinase and response regulator CckA
MFAKIAGRTPEEMEQIDWLKITHPDDVQPDLDNMALMNAGVTSGFHMEKRYLLPDGTPVWINMIIAPVDVKDKSRPRHLCMIEDITARKEAEKAKQEFDLQLLQTQKLESLGVLAGGIAHDFNNILMAIIGNADLALMSVPPESAIAEHLRAIEAASARAADLAKQMLAYSGKGRFVVQSLDMNRLLEEMLHMLKVSISKKAVLSLNRTVDLPTVDADATQIRQVVMNLVINASEAIGDRSGVIAINLGSMECDRHYLKNFWLDEGLPEGTYICLEISDTGCGMDSVTRNKIFDPFFTTKFTGRGLGMAAVLGIMRGHKGAIRVYSEPGKGTTFKLLIPASDKVSEAVAPEVKLDSWRGSGKVLLVDDEETVQVTGSMMLRAMGFDPIVASDGREALESFAAEPELAFVILDLTMPHMDGEQCFRELRRLKPEVKVIMSSGYTEQEVTQRFPGEGMPSFIQKPYKMTELKEVIKGLGE